MKTSPETADRPTPSDAIPTFRSIIRADAVWLTPLILLCALLLFLRLDHYSLWDDEAMTALPSLGVLATGDTSAIVGQNIVAYQNGKHLRGLIDRLAPPLAPYFGAPALAISPTSTFAARAPFALVGLASFAFLLLWLRQAGADKRLTLLVAVGWLCNVSLLLYCRQCRYYSLDIFLTILACHAYWMYLRGRGSLIYISVILGLLYSAFYLAYFVLGACFVVDYLLYGRKARSLAVKDLVAAAITQAIMVLPVLYIWNPIGTGYNQVDRSNTWLQRLDLFFWNFRDINWNEFCSITLLAVALLAAIRFRHELIIRLSVFCLAYIALTSFASPQPLAQATQADVRYLIALIPVFIVITSLAIDWLAGRSHLMAIALALFAFGSNLPQGGIFPVGVQSTPLLFAQELAKPNPDPYTAASTWINTHVQEGESIWVLPEYMMYPLMFHSPKAVYAWQLTLPPKEAFKSLPRIHFQGMAPPDYIFAFGPVVQNIQNLFNDWRSQNITYENAATLPVYWKDLYRPELRWRSFTPVVNFNPDLEAIYIFKRTSPPLGTKFN